MILTAYINDRNCGRFKYVMNKFVLMNYMRLRSELSKLIPEEFKGSMPTIEEIESELS